MICLFVGARCGRWQIAVGKENKWPWVHQTPRKSLQVPHFRKLVNHNGNLVQWCANEISYTKERFCTHGPAVWWWLWLVQFSSVLMSCSKLPLLMLISSLFHEQVEADLERINRTGSHNWFWQTVPFIHNWQWEKLFATTSRCKWLVEADPDYDDNDALA